MMSRRPAYGSWDKVNVRKSLADETGENVYAHLRRSFRCKDHQGLQDTVGEPWSDRDPFYKAEGNPLALTS